MLACTLQGPSCRSGCAVKHSSILWQFYEIFVQEEEQNRLVDMCRMEVQEMFDAKKALLLISTFFPCSCLYVPVHPEQLDRALAAKFY